MAISKVEMQLHKDEYDALIAKSRQAYSTREYTLAVELSQSAWPHIEGMVQFERKNAGRESVSFDGIALPLKLGPLLLDMTILESVKVFLKTERRVLKYCSDDLPTLLSSAEELLWMGYRLWDFLQANDFVIQSELRTRFGGNQDQWRGLAEAWHEMGFVVRSQQGNSYRLSLTTRLDRRVRGKCPSCGSVATAEKSAFLDNAECPKCHKVTVFVLLADVATTR